MREFAIEEKGDNLSDGEKQIVCICRAALRKAKVVIFDEATANIDVVSEKKIMALIKEEFGEATVLTIAHRLNTIIKSNNLIVLADGKKKEQGSPSELLQDENSEFTKLVR